MKFFLLFLLLANSVFAYEFYNNENDFRNNRDYALSDPYDGYDVEPDFDKYECFSLDDYNYYADLDAYDSTDPLTARNIGSDFDNLRYEDQLRIINENPNDGLDENDVDDYNDMECWTLKDYNKYARQKPSDRWDEIYFRDFDDLEQVNDIGIRRYGIIEFDDLQYFDLQRTVRNYDEYD